jgi:DNA-binding NtrC family response regulator
VHRLSPRRAAPFVRINCAALPEQLLESELFGHERGAFTGALAPKPGLIETADSGTMFFDEIAELPLAAQAKLLRVLEDRQVTRVGSVKPKGVDVRFVAATHQDLAERAAAGVFRRDLFFRLNGASITIPPLRDRRVELGLLAQSFVTGAAAAMGRAAPALGPEAASVIEAYAWPGNIRELRNAMERAVALCHAPAIGVEHLPEAMIAPSASPFAAPWGGAIPPAPPTLPPDRWPGAAPPVNDADHQRQRILAALAQCGGHQGRAAKLLGISRRTLVNRLDALGLPRPRKGHEPPGGADDDD